MKLVAVPSMNFEERQDKIQFIILHATDTKTLEETFTHLIDSVEPNRVSAHYVIDRTGYVFALVPEDCTAWHAGISDWNGYNKKTGRNSLNHASIGIELQCEGDGKGDNFKGFTKLQLQACDELVKRLMKRHNIPAQNVLRHSDVAPNRKKDPGRHFPYNKLKSGWEKERF